VGIKSFCPHLKIFPPAGGQVKPAIRGGGIFGRCYQPSSQSATIDGSLGIKRKVCAKRLAAPTGRVSQLASYQHLEQGVYPFSIASLLFTGIQLLLKYLQLCYYC